MKHLTLAIVCLLLLAVAALSFSAPASARGAAATLMNSPGYQRALEESRKRYREQYSRPYTQPPAVTPRKKWRHRGRR
jgi:hypothetical protein